MKAPKKTGLAGAKALAKKPLFPKGSAMAKSPLGKIVEALRDVPAHKIKVWPVEPENSRL